MSSGEVWPSGVRPPSERQQGGVNRHKSPVKNAVCRRRRRDSAGPGRLFCQQALECPRPPDWPGEIRGGARWQARIVVPRNTSTGWRTCRRPTIPGPPERAGNCGCGSDPAGRRPYGASKARNASTSPEAIDSSAEPGVHRVDQRVGDHGMGGVGRMDAVEREGDADDHGAYCGRPALFNASRTRSRWLASL